ncbi:hypothetical protein [Robbsia andropogonis]|uniref:hypothetical protein n=1 Tax=Robbsia andropogonis TaxID=28092 RepID=UPI00046700BF|nr:hypothetical protein [Robbsia andropogonis]
MKRPDLVEMLVDLLRGPDGKRAADALGLESSEVSRFISGQRGLTKDQLNKAMELTNAVIVTRRYLDSVLTLSQVGIYCEMARCGNGECSRR